MKLILGYDGYKGEAAEVFLSTLLESKTTNTEAKFPHLIPTPYITDTLLVAFGYRRQH